MLGGLGYLAFGVACLAAGVFVGSKGNGLVAHMFENAAKYWKADWHSSGAKEARTVLVMRILVSGSLMLFAITLIAAGVIRLP